ncbi:MAG TPA: CocE/NonD family hydrolase [Caulobacteraceae bacterium]|nr:CocE/NonD family hydrolase [Caulobacteraceae bacterium]
MGQPTGAPVNRGGARMTPWRLPDPVGVREIENAWIETPDGVRLAVSLWLPDVAGPAPVVLESIPYRKRDSTRGYSSWWGRKLAERGVGYARLDCRGSGDSGGLLTDEYLPQEQADNITAIAWLAAQPWCNGAVGMRGVSWGGFATLQAAALAPPALRAIMPMCASDRRYTDDAHYVGGAFALTGLKWATSFKAVMAGPPDPEVFGPDWEAEWMRRLEAAPPIAAEWLSHQREDDYWRQGSVGFDPARVRCPVYFVGGWLDPYNDTIPRLMYRLGVPAKALIGPWQHGYPAPATPGPGLDWAFEEVRWWKEHLAGEATGIMDEPSVRMFLLDQSPIEAAPGELRGRWVADPGWASVMAARSLRLSPGRLGDAAGQGTATQRDRGVVGLATPEWVPFAAPTYPQEQSADDAASLVFDSDPLEALHDVFGMPMLSLRIAADRPIAKLAARLCEVTPDGRSWLVAYGVLNLTHRKGHAAPQPLTPGEYYDVRLPFYLTGRRVWTGSRLRLAISESLWPLLWPSPEPVTLTLDLASAVLTLPLRPVTEIEPEIPIPLALGLPSSGRGDPEVVRATADDGAVTYTEVWPLGGGTIEATGTRLERSGANVEASVRPGEPLGCRWRAWHVVRYFRDAEDGAAAWDCTLEAEAELTADAQTFHLRERLVAKRGEAVVFEREHTNAIPRDLM